MGNANDKVNISKSELDQLLQNTNFSKQYAKEYLKRIHKLTNESGKIHLSSLMMIPTIQNNVLSERILDLFSYEELGEKYIDYIELAKWISRFTNQENPEKSASQMTPTINSSSLRRISNAQLANSSQNGQAVSSGYFNEDLKQTTTNSKSNEPKLIRGQSKNDFHSITSMNTTASIPENIEINLSKNSLPIQNSEITTQFIEENNIKLEDQKSELENDNSISTKSNDEDFSRDRTNSNADSIDSRDDSSKSDKISSTKSNSSNSNNKSSLRKKSVHKLEIKTKSSTSLLKNPPKEIQIENNNENETNPLEEKYKFVFRLYDKNGDGFIDENEMITIFQYLVGEEMTESQIKNVAHETIIEYDKDKDGKLKYEEFRSVFSQN